MSFYQQAQKIGLKFFKPDQLLRFGFNLSPMYRRSTARMIEVSKDLLFIKIKLPFSYKNKNYAGSIFGGSMFSAVDPIPMVQLINLLGNNYIVWDKSAEIHFKRPAKEHLFANFTFTPKELEEIKDRVKKENEFEFQKTTSLTNREETKVFCEVVKTIYVADKEYYKNKRRKKRDTPK